MFQFVDSVSSTNIDLNDFCMKYTVSWYVLILRDSSQASNFVFPLFICCFFVVVRESKIWLL